MAETLKVLGQAAPSADTDANLYTVPDSTSAAISSIVICNRGSADMTYRVAVRPAGAALSNEHYIAYGIPLGANDSVPLTLGITLAATDVITVRANSANASFSAFGSEITA